MKVVCPECAHETEVPDDVLGDRGKRVRCAQCKHIWFQEPVSETAEFGRFRSFDESLDIEPIPQSVHPDMADEADDDDDEDGTEKGPSVLSGINYGYLGRMVAGFALGCVLVGGILAGGAKAGVTPALFAPFYGTLGIAAQGAKPLEIKDMKLEGKNLSGWIVNVSDNDAAVPKVTVTLLDDKGSEGASIQITPEQQSLKPKEGLEFKAELPELPADGGKVAASFTR